MVSLRSLHRHRTASRSFQPRVEVLEARCLLDINGLPLLHSAPGAPTAVYLDFNGGRYGSTTYSPYDEDGDPTSFNPTEQAHITEAWRQVSTYFAVFDTDVTTERPTVPFAWDLISNSVSGGYSYVGAFPNSQPRSFNQSSDARTRTSGLTHEIGHNFGLQHQSDYDLNGNKTHEYSSGYDNLHGPLMGVDFARNVHKWFIGHPSNSPSNLQDDLSVIASKIRRYEPAGGDGFRPNDYGSTIDDATPLDDYGGFQFAYGVIERPSDQDSFSFTSDGNPIRIDAMRDVPSPVHVKLEIYQADGTLLAAGDEFNSTDQHLNLTLPADTYYAIVSSHGDYGDLGGYNLVVSAGTPDTPPDYNGLDSPANLALTLGTGTGINLSWDGVDGATGYAIERSSDGASWSQVATTTADVTTYANTGLTGSHRYFYRVSALDDSGLGSVPSAVGNLVDRPSAPFNLTVSSWQTTRLILNWRDVTGDTGYRIERSLDGVNFTAIHTVGTNVSSYTDSGLTGGTRYYYRITALSLYGDSPTSAIASGATRSAAPGPDSGDGSQPEASPFSFQNSLDPALVTAAGPAGDHTTFVVAQTTNSTAIDRTDGLSGTTLAYLAESVGPTANGFDTAYGLGFVPEGDIRQDLFALALGSGMDWESLNV